MPARKASPLGTSVTGGFSPASNVSEVCATARLDQHLLRLAQGETPKHGQALQVDGKSRFFQILEGHLQHSPKAREISEFAGRNVP
jgi:hypothetical protein